jgi:hypothetical protein
VAGLPPVTQAERTFVWELITEITGVCGGGPSVDFMLAAWEAVSTQVHAQIATGQKPQQAGVQEEGAAILRALATSVDMLSKAQVCLQPAVKTVVSCILSCHCTPCVFCKLLSRCAMRQPRSAVGNQLVGCLLCRCSSCRMTCTQL